MSPPPSFSDDDFDDLDAFAREVERNPELKRELEIDLLMQGRNPPSSLPDDLRKLFREVTYVELMRSTGDLLEPPYLFDGFECINAKIGGMGMVIEARDPKLDRKVALKLWKTSGAAADAALLAEAQTLAKLSHPNVVTIYETRRWNERVYFVMEWIEGQDGHDWIDERCGWYSIRETAQDYQNEGLNKRLVWQEVQRVFIAAGNGLAAAHDAKIQHRDFKPGNMLVGDTGRVCVADFGVADSLRSLEVDGEQPETPVGTPTYMAPERLRGQRGDARSDQFSFCAALWKALHGQRPFAGETAAELLESIECGNIRIGSMARGVPQWFQQVVRKGLADDPDQRYPDMHALVQALSDEPSGGDVVGGEPGGVAVGGAGGRLLHAPETTGASGRVELSLDTEASAALLRELVKVLSPGGRSKDGELGDRAARAGHQGRSFLSVTIASFAGGIISAGLVLVMLRPPACVAVEPRETVAAEDDPLNTILAHIEANKFGKASPLWYDERQTASDKRGRSLSDKDSLTIGRACLKRAKELELVDNELASAALTMANDVASFVMDYGSDPEAKEAASQLFAEVKEAFRRLAAHKGATRD